MQNQVVSLFSKLKFCLDLYLNASHLLRYLGVRLLKLGFMDIDADRRN